MDDLISRQAAIDCEYQVKIINDIEYVMLSEVQMKMRKLPSAQPEIIRCRDCKYNDMPSTAGNAGCTLLYGMTNQNGFCSLAERREVSE